jgi:amino acid permease
MKNPERWPEVMNWMYAVIMPMYAFSAVAGFAAYGGFSQANLNLNFPNNSMNVVSLLMQLPACLYLIYFTNLVLVLQVRQPALALPHTLTRGA